MYMYMYMYVLHEFTRLYRKRKEPSLQLLFASSFLSAFLCSCNSAGNHIFHVKGSFPIPSSAGRSQSASTWLPGYRKSGKLIVPACELWSVTWHLSERSPWHVCQNRGKDSPLYDPTQKRRSLRLLSLRTQTHKRSVSVLKASESSSEQRHKNRLRHTTAKSIPAENSFQLMLPISAKAP